MLHRQTAVQPLVSSGPAGGAPPVNQPPAQPSVPVSQPQPGVSRVRFLLNKVMITSLVCSVNLPLYEGKSLL